MHQFERLVPVKDGRDAPYASPGPGPGPVAGAGCGAFRLARDLGNQATQRLYAQGALPAEASTAQGTGAATLHTALQATQGDGRPLEEPIKTFMEASLHTGLDGVRVHTDQRAASLARSLGAEAFTLGRNIYFASARYCPDTAGGARLLAHELTHTIQQGFHDNPLPGALQISTPEDASERQADAAAWRVVGDPAGRAQSSRERIPAQRIAPQIQRATNLEVAIYETKDHSTGYEDAPDEPIKVEANSLNEAGNKLTELIKAARMLYSSATAIGQLSFYGHGAPGSQSVGAGEGWDSTKEISVASLSSATEDYKRIYAPLAGGASVYLRGCNVGAGDKGLQLLQTVKGSCKTLLGKDIEAYGWTGKSSHMRVLAYDWYEQTGERVSGSDKTPKTTWEELKKRGAGKK